MTGIETTSPPRLGAAVVGLGVGEQHARALLSAGCELRWLYDLDEGRSREVATRLGAGRPAPDFEALLEDPEVRIVSIASFDDAHFGQVIESLAARKHLFVEKPLCRSREELARVREAWERAGRPHLASNLVLRAAPLYRWLGEEILRGTLGRIYAIDGEYLYGRLAKITEGWRKDVENYSVVQGGGIHMLDLMLAIAGEAPVRVHAVGNRMATAGTSFRYDDFAAATFTFPSGLVGRLTANFGCVHRHQHVLRVYGTKGTFLYDDAGARLHLSRDPGDEPQTIDLAPKPAEKGALIPAFVAAIRGGADARPGAEREFELVNACLAADEARERGEIIEVTRP